MIVLSALQPMIPRSEQLLIRQRYANSECYGIARHAMPNMLTSAATPRQICMTNKNNNTKVEVIMTFDSQVGYAGIKQADEEKLKCHQSTNADDFPRSYSLL